MFVVTSREELREILLLQISTLEPELAEGLTDLIMDMEDEDIIPLVGDDDALQALVRRLVADFLRRVRVLDEEEIESDDEWAPVPSHLTAATWSPTVDSTIQRAAIVTEREEAYFRAFHGHSRVMPPSPRTNEQQYPVVADDAQRQESKEGPAKTAHGPANSGNMNEGVTKTSVPDQSKAGRFVEATADPAQSNTMKEAIASPANLPERGPQTEAACDSLTSTSTVSYVLGAKRETRAVAPTGPAPQKKGGEESRKAPRLRAPKRDAADHSHPPTQTDAAFWPTSRPARIPPMEAVRQAKPSRRARKPSRRQQPANTGEADDCPFEQAVIGGFLCGVFVACCIFTIW